MLIYPDIQATPDSPTIKFYQPREQIDLNKEIPRILHTQGWSCGTYFNIQFLNHEKTKLLACGRFVVSEEVETLQTNDANPYQPMTRTVFSRRAEQIGGWTELGITVTWNEPVKETINKGLMRVDGKLNEVDIVHPPLIELDTDGIPVFGAEPKRRGRPPNQPKADSV